MFQQLSARRVSPKDAERKERSVQAALQELAKQTQGSGWMVSIGYLISLLVQRSLLISRLLCEGREGSEVLPDSFEIRFSNPVELHAGSESGRTVGNFAVRPGLGFSDPDTDFHFCTLRQRDCHFDVTSADAEIRNRCPEGGSSLSMNLHGIMALEAGVLPHLNESWLVIVGCRRG